jgi:hypothetical protein
MNDDTRMDAEAARSPLSEVKAGLGEVVRLGAVVGRNNSFVFELQL